MVHVSSNIVKSQTADVMKREFNKWVLVGQEYLFILADGNIFVDPLFIYRLN